MPKHTIKGFSQTPTRAFVKADLPSTMLADYILFKSFDNLTLQLFSNSPCNNACLVEEILAVLDSLKLERAPGWDWREVDSREAQPYGLVQVLKDWARVQVHKALCTR